MSFFFTDCTKHVSAGALIHRQQTIYRPFPHSTSVRTNNRTRAKLGWTFSYICCIFVHPNPNSVPLFVGMRERSIGLYKEKLFYFFIFFCLFVCFFPTILDIHCYRYIVFPIKLINYVMDKRIYKLLNFVLQFGSEWKTRSKEGINCLCGARWKVLKYCINLFFFRTCCNSFWFSEAFRPIICKREGQHHSQVELNH